MADPIYDVLSSFEAGMNSGVEPSLLSKNQLANLVNGTVRGGFVTHRPSKVRRNILYPGGDEIKSAVEDGAFQGAGIYRYDSGVSIIIASISGRLFTFTPSGIEFVCNEITIANDANSQSARQVWMWQAEKWMIITDGTSALPIFFDGATCRRSYGPSVVLATVTAGAPAAPPAVGEIFTATLSANWNGPFNVPVIFNGEYYEPTEIGSTTPSYSASIQNGRDDIPQVIASGTEIVIDDNRVGLIKSVGSVYIYPFYYSDITFYSEHGLSVGSSINVLSIINTGPPAQVGYATVSVVQVSTPTSIRCLRPSLGVVDHSVAYKTGSTLPIISVGKSIGITNIAAGGTSAIVLDALYSGSDGKLVWVGDSPFLLSAGAAIAPSTTLNLRNLTDTSAAAYAFVLEIRSIPEFPAGRMGAYGQSRNWMSKTDGISFLGGDIVSAASGTVAHNYRDSVLKTTENDFLEGRGAFQLPGSGSIITSMDFMALLDQTLGQGPLMVSTGDGIFACQVPVDSDWANLDTPILPEVFIGNGPTGFYTNINVENDLYFRSVEGIGTLKMARRDFDQNGGFTISREVDSLLRLDSQSLLPMGSAILFDNRILFTVRPSEIAVSDGLLTSVKHSGCVVLNRDSISNIRGKLPPCWEGYWGDFQILQFLSGFLDGKNRAFFFSAGSGGIELNEILKDGDSYNDGGEDISWSAETSIIFGSSVKKFNQLVQLQDGEIHVKDVRGTVNVVVSYRPDFYPNWVPWRSFTITADATSNPGYRTRIGLGEPSPDPCEEANNRPLRIGHIFQTKIEVTGSCKIMGMRFQATPHVTGDFATPICNLPVVVQNIQSDLTAP